MKLPPVVVLAGSDEYQKRIFLEETRKEFFPNGPTGFNDDRFDSKERTAQEIVDLCNTLPMVAERRLVVVRNLEQISESDQTKWVAYFSRPSPQTMLVITCEKLDKRTKFAKTVDQLGFSRDVEPPHPRELPNWLEKIGKRHRVTFAPDAKEELIGCVGANLGLLDQQVEKLALYIHPEKSISKESVSKLVLQSSGDHIFAWTDQVLEGKLILALATLSHLMEEGNPALVVLTMLARHVRILIKAKDLMARKVSTREMPPQLGVPPFVVQKYVDQARGFTMDQLENTLSELAYLDQELKSTSLDSKTLLERTIFKISDFKRAKVSARL